MNSQVVLDEISRHIEQAEHDKAVAKELGSEDINDFYDGIVEGLALARAIITKHAARAGETVAVPERPVNILGSDV